MPQLSGEEIADMVQSTQRDLGRMKWVDLAHDLQDFVVMPMILKKERIKFDGGTGSEFKAQTTTNGSARNTGLFAQDIVNQPDTLTKGFVPWRHTTCNYAYDEREVRMNANEYKIVDLVKTQRTSALGDLAEKLETNFWSKPADSTDLASPWGVPMHIVKNATTPGFVGGNPTGFSDASGINSTAVPRWKNWAGQYTTVSKSDLVAKMRKATTFTGFKSPVAVPSYDMGNVRRTIYTNYAVIGALETLAEQQNDRLGPDVASMDGRVMFRRIPMQWVPFLEADTSNPVYGIDWSTFTTIFLRGEYLNEMAPIRAPKQHRVWEVHIDCSYNWRCHNRRRNFVLSLS